MANPSVTYTFTNGTTADGTQVSQNFTDIINALTDGTKSLSIDALTCAGTFTANGAVNLGNASTDDITITGSLASSIPIKTNNSYNIGAATLGLAGLYLGAPSSRSTRLTAHQSLSASNTLVLPNGNGNANQKLVTDGSGNMSWVWGSSYVSKNDNYTVLDTDGYDVIGVTVTAKTITLPTAADNTNRVITIVHDISGGGNVTIKGEAAGETVDGITGTTGRVLYTYKESLTLICTGTVWLKINHFIPSNWTSFTPTLNSDTGVASKAAYWMRDGENMYINGVITYNNTGANSAWQITLPEGNSVNTTTSQSSLVGGPSSFVDASSGWKYAANYKRSSTAIGLILENTLTELNSNAFANGDYIMIVMGPIPISGWWS